MDENVTPEEVAPEPVEAPAAAPKAKKKKKAPIIIGVVVAVLVVAGAGFYVWHEQPSFCSAICHTPMDPYLTTYEATPGESATDKWGNEVKDASGMLACVHRVDGEESGTSITCMSCHVPTLGEQINEGAEWVTGNYTVTDNSTYGLVLYETDLTKLVEARGISEEEFCLNSSCHNLTKAELAEKTSSYERNPHDLTGSPHNDTWECSDCHKAHRASVNACTQCHSDAPTPEGWITYTEAKKLETAIAES